MVSHSKISRGTALLLFSVLINFALVLANSSPKLILTTKNYALESDKKFSAYDKIHGYLTLSVPLTGVHTLETVWRGPNEVMSRSKADIDFSKSSGQTAYIWLDLGSEGGLLSSLRGQESDNSKYVGNWHVETLLDGQPLIKKDFLVN